MVTRSQIDAANPELVLALIDSWRSAAAGLETTADDYVRLVERPGGQLWSGRTAEATMAMASSDRKTIVGGADEVTGMADRTFRGVTESVMPKLSNVRAMIDNAERQGFVVNDDLSVSWTRPSGMSDASAEKYQQATTSFSAQIKEAATDWWAAEQRVAEQMDRDRGGLRPPFSATAGGQRSGVQLVDHHVPLTPGGPLPEDPAPPGGEGEQGSGRGGEHGEPPAPGGIEGATPGGDPYPDELGPPVPGTTLPRKPEPPAWQPKDPGAGPFGSWEPRPGDAVQYAEAKAGAWWKSDEIPHAARNFNHYFDVTGTPLPQDVRQMLHDIPEFQGLVDRRTQQLAAEAISRAQLAGTTGPLTFPVNTIWNGAAAHQSGDGPERDWFYAMGSFDYNLTGQITVLPPAAEGHPWTYSYDGDVNVRDRYNWDLGKSTKIGGSTVTDAEMARFQRIGWAREFTMTGSTGIHRNG